MQLASDTNQLLPVPQAASRYTDLRVWMLRNNVSCAGLGRSMGGITGNAVQQLLKGERISSARHAEFIALGLPKELLPPAVDVPRGPKFKS